MFDTQPVIDQAARWLRSNPVPRNLEVKVLRERFGLSAIAACQVIALARNLPVRRAGDAA